MRMGRECKRVREQMEAWEHSPPAWAQAHLRKCTACANEWQREQGYRRVVQTARHEPMPACQLRWELVQAQLAARAVRQRTLRWRLALAGAFASLFVFIALGSLWLIYSGSGRAANSRWQMEGKAPAALASKRMANGKWRMEGEAPAEPKTPSPSTGRAGVGDWSEAPAELKTPSPSTGRAGVGDWSEAPAPITKPVPIASASPPTAHPQSETISFYLFKARSESLPMSESGSAVALLPLPDLHPEASANAEYLPVQYSGSEESHVYSF